MCLNSTITNQLQFAGYGGVIGIRLRTVLKYLLIVLAGALIIRVLVSLIVGDILYQGGLVFSLLLIAGFVLCICFFSIIKGLLIKDYAGSSVVRKRINFLGFYTLIAPLYFVIAPFLFAINFEELIHQLLFKVSVKEQGVIELTVDMNSKTTGNARWRCKRTISFKEYSGGRFCVKGPSAIAKSSTFDKFSAVVIFNHYGVSIVSVSPI